MYKNNKSKFKHNGFTLVEVIVSMAIFLFIIGIALAVFISIIKVQRNILSEQKIINQVSYVQEYMSKALRMAKLDETGDCINDDDTSSEKQYIYLLTRQDLNGFYKGIKFINQSDDDACTEFFLDNTTDPTHPILKEVKYVDGVAGEEIALTSSDLEINYLKFAINGVDAKVSSGLFGASKDQIDQPRLTINLSIKIRGDQGEEASKIIQTTISERNLNVQ